MPLALIHSPLPLAARKAGLVASQAEKAKTQKYALLGSSHHFVPVAIKTSGVFGPDVIAFIKELGHRIRAETGEPRSLQFLMQGIAVAVQRGNELSLMIKWLVHRYCVSEYTYAISTV